MNDFGKGPTLEQANPWLRDEVERVERILGNLGRGRRWIRLLDLLDLTQQTLDRDRM